MKQAGQDTLWGLSASLALPPSTGCLFNWAMCPLPPGAGKCFEHITKGHRNEFGIQAFFAHCGLICRESSWPSSSLFVFLGPKPSLHSFIYSSSIYREPTVYRTLCCWSWDKYNLSRSTHFVRETYPERAKNDVMWYIWSYIWWVFTEYLAHPRHASGARIIVLREAAQPGRGCADYSCAA